MKICSCRVVFNLVSVASALGGPVAEDTAFHLDQLDLNTSCLHCW